MRIISGTMRGTKLFTLEGLNTRPTLDRVKEALFSKINYDLEDATILEIIVTDDDKGVVIGRGGKMANAIRTLVQAHGYLLGIKNIKINIDSF